MSRTTIFCDKTNDSPKDTGEYGYDVQPVPTVVGAKLPQPSDKPVMVAQTLDDRRAYPVYPRYDALSVVSVVRPRFGRDY